MGVFDFLISPLSKYNITKVEFNRDKTKCKVEYELIYLGNVYHCSADIFIIGSDSNVVNNTWILLKTYVKEKNMFKNENKRLSLKTQKEIYDFYTSSNMR